MSSMSLTMDLGWPSTAILVSPGMSTRVRLGTLGDVTCRLIGFGDTDTPPPHERWVSASISWRIASKSV